MERPGRPVAGKKQEKKSLTKESPGIILKIDTKDVK
jgi:hypothetical protein